MELDPVGPEVLSLEETVGVPPDKGTRRARRALLWLTSLVILAGLAFWLIVQRDAYRTFRSELTAYRGVTIGQSKIEVQYVVGIPQTVQGPETRMANGGTMSVPLRVDDRPDPNIPPNYDRVPDGTGVESYDSWHYWNAEGTFDVEFNARSHRVESITCWAETERRQRPCPPLFGVQSGMSEDEVITRLGQPDNSEMLGGGMLEGAPIVVTKALTYDTLGLRLDLQENRVATIRKRAPGEVNFWWWLTHGRP